MLLTLIQWCAGDREGCPVEESDTIREGSSGKSLSRRGKAFWLTINERENAATRYSLKSARHGRPQLSEDISPK